MPFRGPRDFMIRELQESEISNSQRMADVTFGKSYISASALHQEKDKTATILKSDDGNPCQCPAPIFIKKL